MEQYDIVFVGYPIWAGGLPQVIRTFLSSYDLSGKTVIPFCTHDGYGAGGSYAGIASAIEGETAVLDGLAIEATDVPESEDVVLAWLREIGVQAASNDSTETKITITIGDTVLNGLLYDTALALLRALGLEHRAEVLLRKTEQRQHNLWMDCTRIRSYGIDFDTTAQGFARCVEDYALRL